MKAYGGGVAFFISALLGGERSASRPCRFTFGDKASGTHWISFWVWPRARLDAVENYKPENKINREIYFRSHEGYFETPKQIQHKQPRALQYITQICKTEKILQPLRYEILTAISTEVTVLWDVTPCTCYYKYINPLKPSGYYMYHTP
jgi:hypothetical protein